MVDTNNGQSVFFPDLQEFCTKYLVIHSSPISENDQIRFPEKYLQQQQSLFEHFLLFDQISFKVDGENVPLAILLNLFGIYELEKLLEQGAIKFVSWTPLVGFVKSEVPGVNALVSGTRDALHYIDPEKSIDFGFRWLKSPPEATAKKRLLKKIVPLYEFPSKDLASSVVKFTNSTFVSGNLKSFGLSPDIAPLDNLPLVDRERLCKCAAELGEYCFLIESGMTSFSSYEYFSFFSGSVERINALKDTTNNFGAIAKLEGFPALKGIYSQLDQPLNQISKLRAKPSSQKFRKWLAENTEMDTDIAMEYVRSIADAKSIFDNPLSKVGKSILMGTIGLGVGSLIDASLTGAAVGSAFGVITQRGPEIGLDLTDKFLLEGFQKGWTPRIFFDDLRKLKTRKSCNGNLS